MKKLMIVLGVLIIAQGAMARPEADNMAICYEVKNNSIKSKIPCIVTNSGGAGTSILEYSFKGKEYTIVEDNDGSTLNDQPYTGYMRDAFFAKTREDDQMQYYCYQSKQIHFCASQPN